LLETNATVEQSDGVERLDISEYLAHLADRQHSGVSRARKLTAIREYFRFAQAQWSASRAASRQDQDELKTSLSK
jgi:site-specific recombinase XerD